MKKRHILVLPGITFCGQKYNRRRKENPIVCAPDYCDCKVCLYRFYFYNPLQRARERIGTPYVKPTS